MRLDLIENESFILELEYNEEFFVLHLPWIKPSSIQAVKDLKAKLVEMKAFANTVGYNELYTAIEPNDTSMEKLMGILKAEYLGTEDGAAVYVYRGE